MKLGLVPCVLMVVEGLQVQEGILCFCIFVLLDLLVFVLDIREAKGNEFGSFLERK